MQQSCLLDFGPIQPGASFPRVEGRVSRESSSSVNTQHWTPVTRHSFVKASSKIISLSPSSLRLSQEHSGKSKNSDQQYSFVAQSISLVFPSDLLTANKV